MAYIEKESKYFICNGIIVKKDRFTGKSLMLNLVENEWNDLEPATRNAMKGSKPADITVEQVEDLRTACAVATKLSNGDANLFFRISFIDAEMPTVTMKAAAILSDCATHNHDLDFKVLAEDIHDRKILELAYRATRHKDEKFPDYIGRVSKDKAQRLICLKQMEYRLKNEDLDEKTKAILEKYHGKLAVE